MKLATLALVLFILLVPSTVLAQGQALDKPVVSLQVDSAVHLSWSAVPNAASYEVWTWDEHNEWQLLVDDHSETQVSHTNFVPGRVYWYAVRANDETRHSDWSDFVSATAPELETPTPTATPVTNTPTPASIHEVSSAPALTAVAANGVIQLSWGAVAHAQNYEIWRWFAGVWEFVSTTPHLSYVDTDVNAGNTYYYAIAGLNTIGARGPWSGYHKATVPANTSNVMPSPTATATPTATPTATLTPAPASIHEVSSAPALTAVAANGVIQLSWGAVAHAQNYEIWRWFAGVWEFVSTTPHLSYVDTDVNAGNTYYYAIAGLNTIGTRGPWSGYHKATVPADTSDVMPSPTATATPTATLTPTPTPTPSSNPERAALIALYRATDGPNWVRGTNWLSNAPLSRWYGVSTNESGNVTDLTLYGNNLRGSIPPELGNLTSLTSLTLDTNELSGTIPKELGKLTNLTQLRLYNNTLDGELPSEVANLPNLSSILLDNEQESLLTLGKGWGESMRAMTRVGGVIVVATNGVTDLAVERVAEIISGMLTNRPDLLAAMADYRTKVILRPVNFRGHPGNASYTPNTDAENPIIRVVINASSGGLSSMPKPSCGTTIHELAHAIHYSLIESQGCCAPSAPSPPGGQQAPGDRGVNPAQAFDGQLQALYAAAMANGLWAGQYAATNHYEYWAVTVPIWLGLGQFSLADYDPNLATFIETTLGDDAYVPDYCLK